MIIGKKDTGRRYNFLKSLNVGSAGETFLADDNLSNKCVAIKLLYHKLVNNIHVRARFEREQKVTMDLSHPFIVKGIGSIFVIDNNVKIPGFVTEYIEGTDLIDRYPYQQPLFQDESAMITVQIALALDYLHARGIVHRDMRDDNIRVQTLTSQGDYGVKATLLDFGLIKMIGCDNQDEVDNSRQDGQTLTNRLSASLEAIAVTATPPLTTVGSPTFMSPEQARCDRTIDGRADLYGLGVNLYKMITGTFPFISEPSCQQTILNCHIYHSPPALSAHSRYRPTPLDAICLKLLEKDPDKRYQTGLELARAVITAPPDHQAELIYGQTVELLGYDWMQEARPAQVVPLSEQRIVVPSEPASYARGCE